MIYDSKGRGYTEEEIAKVIEFINSEDQFDKDLALHLLEEAWGFAAISPRGKDNIAAVIEMIERVSK